MVPCVKRCKIFHKSGAILQKIATPGWRDRRPVHGTFYVTLSNSVRSSFARIVTCWQGVFWKVPGKINWLKVSRRNCPIQCWIISARDLLARTGRLSTTRSGQSQWRCMVRSRLGKFGMQIPMLLIMIELLRHVVSHPFHPCDVVPMCCIFMTRSAFCEHGGPQSNIGNHDDIINNCSNVTKDFASLDYWQRSGNPGPPGVFHTCGNPLVHWLHVLWGQSGADMMCLYQRSPVWLSGQSCAGQVVDGLDTILLGHVVEPVRGTLEAHGMASLDGQMVRAGIRKHPLISFRFSMSKQF